MGYRCEHPSDPKYGILVETCSLCGLRQAACKPASGTLRVCRRCALEALPAPIAQAVLADPETRRPLLGGLEAADEVRKNYEYALLYYSQYYEELYRDEHFPRAFWEGPGGEDSLAIDYVACYDDLDDDFEDDDFEEDDSEGIADLKALRAGDPLDHPQDRHPDLGVAAPESAAS